MLQNYTITLLFKQNLSWGKSLLYFSLSLIFSSCISHKDLLNLQEDAAKHKDTLTLNSVQPDYLLQSGDLLSIKVSSLDEQSVAIFNKTIGQSNTNQITEASLYVNSYIVNDSGFVVLPIIGNVAVKGLSIEQTQKLLEEKVSLYYKYASVDVKLVNFRITVLGEVTRQGTYLVYNTKATILQMIGEAGGITDLGNRKRIRIIRKQNDRTEMAYINIQSYDLIKSNYYFVQPNDVIYVEPLRVKNQRLDLPVISVTLSALTLLVLIINVLNR